MNNLNRSFTAEIHFLDFIMRYSEDQSKVYLWKQKIILLTNYCSANIIGTCVYTRDELPMWSKPRFVYTFCLFRGWAIGKTNLVFSQVGSDLFRAQLFLINFSSTGVTNSSTYSSQTLPEEKRTMLCKGKSCAREPTKMISGYCESLFYHFFNSYISYAFTYFLLNCPMYSTVKRQVLGQLGKYQCLLFIDTFSCHTVDSIFCLTVL